jgi:gliding motility-associated lipoprotein GldD
MKKTIFALLALLLLACGEEHLIPKPPTYLKLELPGHQYESYVDSCGYSFDLPTIYTVEKAPTTDENLCHRRIQLGALNGTVYFRYWDMTQPLSFYVNNANDEIDRHKGKALEITDNRILRFSERVFGALFQLDGDVATPFQFYLTDSTERFVYGEVLFNSSPNYDSIKPSLNYLKKDLEQLLETFKWEH